MHKQQRVSAEGKLHDCRFEAGVFSPGTRAAALIARLAIPWPDRISPALSAGPNVVDRSAESCGRANRHSSRCEYLQRGTWRPKQSHLGCQTSDGRSRVLAPLHASGVRLPLGYDGSSVQVPLPWKRLCCNRRGAGWSGSPCSRPLADKNRRRTAARHVQRDQVRVVSCGGTVGEEERQ